MKANPPEQSRLWTGDFAQILIANCVIFTAFQLLVPVLPLYIADMGGNEATVGLIVGALTFAATLVRPFLGWIIDRRGRKIILIASIALFGIAGLAYPFAISLAALLAIRIIQGISWSGVLPAGSAIAADLIPPQRRGEGISYLSASQSVAMAIGPAIGLFVAEALGYTHAFLASAAFAFLAFALASRIRDPYVAPEETAVFRFRDLIERSSVAPSVITALMTFIFGGLTAFVPLDALNRDLGNPSVFFVTFAVGLVIIRPISGSISDRQTQRGLLLFPGIILIAVALLVLAFTETPWTLPVTALLWAGGFGTAQPVLRAMVLDRAPRERWGAANSLIACAYDLGMALGALLLGIVASQVGIPTMFALASLTMAAALALAVKWGLHRE